MALYQLKSGSWIDPAKVSSVYISWERRSQNKYVERVEVIVEGVQIIAIPTKDIADFPYGYEDACKQRDELAQKLINYSVSSTPVNHDEMYTLRPK